jgi:putative ABC transport system ATP-binding protein
MAGPLIRAVGLKKSYATSVTLVHAVSDVSFTIEAGEFVAIVGRSGSGKSTLMSLLGLLERPDSGSYMLNDREVAGLDEEARAALRSREIGFVKSLRSRWSSVGSAL